MPIAAGFRMPIAPAICVINAIWFIIISWNIMGFVIPAMAAMSMPGIPFMGKPPGAPPIIIAISGLLAVMLSMRAWMSSLG